MGGIELLGVWNNLTGNYLILLSEPGKEYGSQWVVGSGKCRKSFGVFLIGKYEPAIRTFLLGSINNVDDQTFIFTCPWTDTQPATEHLEVKGSVFCRAQYGNEIDFWEVESGSEDEIIDDGINSVLFEVLECRLSLCRWGVSINLGDLHSTFAQSFGNELAMMDVGAEDEGSLSFAVLKNGLGAGIK